MKKLNKEIKPILDTPVKVVQFGEGNFLRGFVDWMIHKTNQQGLFNGRVRVIQPLPNGLVDLLNDQDGLYTHITRGISRGKIERNVEIINSIESGVNPYKEFDKFLETADLPELRFVVSNTTEAGIAYVEGEKLEEKPQLSYPGKLTAFLYRRFKTYKGDPSKGLVVIPCELIDRNGDNLKRIVLQISKEWKLEDDFILWIVQHNAFLNSLVDRIVTGYPREEIEDLNKELGYVDNVLDTSELFHLWVIEGDKKYADEFPLAKAGYNVIWTDDMTPYRTRKVRILNGVHTMTCMAAFLYGIDTVGNCFKNDVINKFITKGLYDEIIPAVDFDKDELKSFAADVFERFANPFIEHQLISITLNSVSKYKARVLPTVIEYIEQFNKAPEILSFSLAALIKFYNGGGHPVKDAPDVLKTFKTLWNQLENSDISNDQMVVEVLSNIDFWGVDLTEYSELLKSVAYHFNMIQNDGIKKALESLV